MVLNFGIFAGILNCCRQGLPGVKFVPRIAWIVDKRNSSLGSELNFVVTDDKLDGMEGNSTVVSKLLACKQSFELTDEYRPSLEVAREEFKSKVLPFIDEDKIAKAILTILHIISRDGTIVTERKESFKKYVGMYRDELLKQEKFNVSDFFTRVLLYTICVDNNEGYSCIEEIVEFLAGNVDNREGCSYTETAKEPKKTRRTGKIEKIMTAFIEYVANDSWVEAKWDATTQTVELIPTKEGQIWDAIIRTSELRLALINQDMDQRYTDTSWLGIDERALFPSKHMQMEFKNPEAKKLMIDKMAQYRKLVLELVNSLKSNNKRVNGQKVKWPLFPDERLRNIDQQITALSDELFVMSIFSDRGMAENFV